MTETTFLILRTCMITLMTLGMMASMTEFRFGIRKLLGVLGLYLLWVLLSTWALLRLGGEVLLYRLLLLTISAPAVALTYWATKDSPSQAVFNYTTQILVSLLSTSLIRFFFPAPLVNILLTFSFFAVIIYLEWRFLRKPFRQLITIMPSGWNMLTIIPCVFCGYLMFVAAWPQSYQENFSQRIYGYAFLVPVVVVYTAIFKSLLRQYRAQVKKQNAKLLAFQVSALQQQLEKVSEGAEAMKILRHDLRHWLQTAAALAERGEKEALLKFLASAQQQLSDAQPRHWCHPPILDAVFSSYFEQARKQEISVDAKISLPDTLPIEEGELAIVIANALENAIHANAALPREQRKIRMMMVGHPSVLLEISNPCTGQVEFDSQGLPVSRQPGHGLGVQSINAFCQKYGAVCRFSLEDSNFHFQLVL